MIGDSQYFTVQLDHPLTWKCVSFPKGDYGLIRNTRELSNQHKYVQVKTSYDKGELKGIQELCWQIEEGAENVKKKNEQNAVEYIFLPDQMPTLCVIHRHSLYPKIL